MLESCHAGQSLVQLRQLVKCQVELPPGWSDPREAPRGPLPSRPNESRRFPRFHFRVRALLECRSTFPSIPFPRDPHVVYTMNISRGGLAFLHSEQLLPNQLASIWLPGAVQHDLAVVYCRRLNDKCFKVGARFSVNLEHLAVSALLKHYV